MLRFVMVSLLLSLLVYMVYAKLFKKTSAPNAPKKSADNGQFKKQGANIMVACAKCGTFTETLDSIAVDGKFYCSKECAGVK